MHNSEVNNTWNPLRGLCNGFVVVKSQATQYLLAILLGSVLLAAQINIYTRKLGMKNFQIIGRANPSHRLGVETVIVLCVSLDENSIYVYVY